MNDELKIEKTISKLLKKSIAEAKGRIQQFRFLNVFGHVITKWGFVKQINLHPYGVKSNAIEIEKSVDYNDYFESRFLRKGFRAWSVTSLIQFNKDEIIYPGILTQIFYNPDLRRNYIDIFELVEKKWGGFFSIIYRDVKIKGREIFEGKIEYDRIFEKMKEMGYELR